MVVHVKSFATSPRNESAAHICVGPMHACIGLLMAVFFGLMANNASWANVNVYIHWPPVRVTPLILCLLSQHLTSPDACMHICSTRSAVLVRGGASVIITPLDGLLNWVTCSPPPSCSALIVIVHVLIAPALVAHLSSSIAAAGVSQPPDIQLSVIEDTTLSTLCLVTTSNNTSPAAWPSVPLQLTSSLFWGFQVSHTFYLTTPHEKIPMQPHTHA